MSPSRRWLRAGLPAIALAVGAAVAGCTTPARADAAALVDDEPIAAEHVSAAVDRVLASQPGSRPGPAERAELQRQQLGRLINAEVLAAAAREKGVAVAPAEVDERLAQLRARFGGQRELEQQAARVGVGRVELRAFVRQLVLTDTLGDTLLSQAPVEQVRAAHILVRDRATADRLAAQVRADPTRFPALAQEFSTDAASTDRGGDLGYQTRGAFVPAFSDAVFARKPGEVVVVRTDFGWHVVRVVDRRPVPVDRLPPAEKEQVLAQERNGRVAALLADTAQRLRVTVNPRFGDWDDSTLTVTPARDELSVPDTDENTRGSLR